MKLLAVDTSNQSCSVGIIDNDRLLAEITLNTGQTHSKQIMKLIDTALTLSGLIISEIDGLAVTLGPGSFTGLRIGLSTIKGIASAGQKPVVGISSLDVLAFQYGNTSNLICVLLDARKGEVYSARYRSIDGMISKIEDEAVQPPGQAISDINEPCLFIGNGALLHRTTIIEKVGEFVYFPPQNEHMIRASSVAYMGRLKFKKDDTGHIDGIVPHYIRKSDAELKRKTTFMK